MEFVDDLSRLNAWFIDHCDDDWEHGQGIELESLDDPGWWLRVALLGTELEEAPFERISVGEEEGHRPFGVPLSEQRPWYRCEVRDGLFEAMRDPTNLRTILRIFLEFAARHAEP